MISAFCGKTPLISAKAYIAPGSVIIGDVTVEEDASIWFQTVLRGDINSISIGKHSNVQDGCLLHVTRLNALFLGARVTVGHGVILHACRIGNDCLIGMGAIILDGAIVEDGCIIGAGSLVPPGMHVKAESLVMGSPARLVRRVSVDDVQRIEQGWRNYVEYARCFEKEIKS